jgi:hypothetical protein
MNKLAERRDLLAEATYVFSAVGHRRERFPLLFDRGED